MNLQSSCQTIEHLSQDKLIAAESLESAENRTEKLNGTIHSLEIRLKEIEIELFNKTSDLETLRREACETSSNLNAQLNEKQDQIHKSEKELSLTKSQLEETVNFRKKLTIQ